MTITYSKHAKKRMNQYGISGFELYEILNKLSKLPKKKFYVLYSQDKIGIVGRPSSLGIHLITIMDSCTRINLHGDAEFIMIS